MKNAFSFFAMLYMLILLPQVAQATFQRVDCQDVIQSNTLVTLLLVNQELRQVRIQTSGSLPYPIMVTRLQNQNIDGVTLYTVISTSSLMKIDNSIFSGKYGQVEIDHRVFSCLP